MVDFPASYVSLLECNGMSRQGFVSVAQGGRPWPNWRQVKGIWATKINNQMYKVGSYVSPLTGLING